MWLLTTTTTTTHQHKFGETMKQRNQRRFKRLLSPLWRGHGRSWPGKESKIPKMLSPCTPYFQLAISFGCACANSTSKSPDISLLWHHFRRPEAGTKDYKRSCTETNKQIPNRYTLSFIGRTASPARLGSPGSAPPTGPPSSPSPT